MFASDMPDLFRFKTPAVRHLDWLCQAPQLVQHSSVFHPAAYLPADYRATLHLWDDNPDIRPDILNATPHYRLGYYVESLYACLLQDLLGWTLLARNLPVRTTGQTLGELDFVVLNKQTGCIEHHEIAIKFYLGYAGDNDRPAGWYGPNPRDRLDLKTARMLGEQSQRSMMPETTQVLAQLGIAQPEVSRVFMPGYLFYPAEHPLPTACSTQLDRVPANHLRAHWMYLDNVNLLHTRTWVPLIKPHWLGPWRQPQVPESTEVAQALSDVTQTPRLFAILHYDTGLGLWTESDRVFVVPQSWPTSPGA